MRTDPKPPSKRLRSPPGRFGGKTEAVAAYQLGKSNVMMASLTTDKGAVGALLHDEKMKEDVKETVASVKEAASTAKEVA